MRYIFSYIEHMPPDWIFIDLINIYDGYSQIHIIDKSSENFTAENAKCNIWSHNLHFEGDNNYLITNAYKRPENQMSTYVSSFKFVRKGKYCNSGLIMFFTKQYPFSFFIKLLARVVRNV